MARATKLPIELDGESNLTFRGAALGNVLDPNDMPDPLREYLTAEWFTIGDREYPPWYYHAITTHRPNPVDLERVRRELGGVPRLDVSTLDILFNGSIRCWEIVKWIAEPGGQTLVPGLGWVTTQIHQPLDIYTLDFGRTPATLSDRDFEWIRRNSVTLRDPGVLDSEMDAYNQAMQASREKDRQDFEYDLAHYYHGAIRREAEETGLAYATPEDMARMFGGEPWMYDPDYTHGGE